MYEIKLANVLWDRPFNLQGGGQVFYPKNILILNLGKKEKIWLFRRKENIPTCNFHSIICIRKKKNMIFVVYE
jgi:hypothetical protein